MTDVILGLLILSPALLTFFLKSNAGLGFLVLCAGFVLSTSVIGDLKELLNQMDLSVGSSTLAITLLVAPLVLTLLLSKGSHSRGLRFYLELVVAVAAGGLLALSVAPLISASDFNLSNSKVWENLVNVQAAVIGAGALLSLVLVWSSGAKHLGKKKHK